MPKQHLSLQKIIDAIEKGISALKKRKLGAGVRLQNAVFDAQNDIQGKNKFIPYQI